MKLRRYERFDNMNIVELIDLLSEVMATLRYRFIESNFAPGSAAAKRIKRIIDSNSIITN